MSAGLRLIAVILSLVACCLAAPCLVALYHGESTVAAGFGAIAGVYGFIALALFMAQRNIFYNLKRIEIFALLFFVWLGFISSAALPLWLSTSSPFEDVVFETVAALTTSNASLFENVDELPRSIVFWRALLQWLGGYLMLISIAVVLAPTGLGGLPRRQISILRNANILGGGHIVKTALSVGLAYMGLTAACAMLLSFSGVPVFDSLCLAAGALSTGGFMPQESSIAAYKAPGAGIILLIFMMIGATSLLWHQLLFNRRWRLFGQQRENYYILAAVFIVGGFLSITMLSKNTNPDLTLGAQIFNGFFLAGSLVSTTGYIFENSLTQHIPLLLFSALVLIGGSAYSTAGGIKFYRLAALCMQAFNELNRLLFPHSVHSARLMEEGRADSALYRAIWSYFAIALLLIWGCSGVLSLENMPYEAALFAAVSAFATVGGLYELGWGETSHWPSYSDMSAFSKMALSITMLLSRLEILILFGILNPIYWKTR